MQISGGAGGMVMDEIDTCIMLVQYEREQDKSYDFLEHLNNNVCILL